MIVFNSAGRSAVAEICAIAQIFPFKPKLRIFAHLVQNTTVVGFLRFRGAGKSYWVNKVLRPNSDRYELAAANLAWGVLSLLTRTACQNLFGHGRLRFRRHLHSRLAVANFRCNKLELWEIGPEATRVAGEQLVSKNGCVGAD
jgi:hypothetical protein